ncbi:hypothetical protein BD289DRAFT_223798 [Coniella lustricola]|uniref:Uncharacterized protein n=1 Tax=Coniella lustricola TaxID=2025994 RepID=A0A2T3AAY8_9PEZI|nr:hypothetical protein BD289DRAFT_223798 [Coniella lustricola]
MRYEQTMSPHLALQLCATLLSNKCQYLSMAVAVPGSEHLSTTQHCADCHADEEPKIATQYPRQLHPWRRALVKASVPHKQRGKQQQLLSACTCTVNETGMAMDMERHSIGRPQGRQAARPRQHRHPQNLGLGPRHPRGRLPLTTSFGHAHRAQYLFAWTRYEQHKDGPVLWGLRVSRCTWA